MNLPGESAQYRAARDRLLEAEVELRRQTEAVAAMRRELPPGGVVPQDYVFDEDGREVAFSDLFGDHGTLVIYSFMFPRSLDDDMPCPACTSILDSLDGAARHLVQRVALAVVAKAPSPRIRAYAHQRGWSHLRLLSSAANDYNRDYNAEGSDGSQAPIFNVFSRRAGEIRHFWGSELMSAPTEEGQEPRHVDFIWPVWNVLDTTPEGRGTDWSLQREY
ncbi:MAG: hypothetical protein V7607_236 [Solirubrobacteraceae bacterium]